MEAQMEPAEMIEILEGIARDEKVNATGRCTAIRTLSDLDPPSGVGTRRLLRTRIV
jgi:hypothetical protein